MENKSIWLVGSGYMAREYAKVLTAMQIPFIVIGRGSENCGKITEEFGCSCFVGGIQKFLEGNPSIPEKAIIAVGIEALAETTKIVLNYGVRNILLEKPGIGYVSEIDSLVELSKEKTATVLLAYNRRFYASVIKARELIESDGGISSFQFEFTEWSHSIRNLQKSKAERHNWFLGNSTHLIDTAFFLGGKPTELCAYVKGGIDWHPTSSVFAGAGISDKGALFSYHANWEAPGRWVLELLTKKRRYIFKPMEKLQSQEIGSVVLNPVEIDDHLDIEFKPGIYLQTKSFLNDELAMFFAIENQQEMIKNVYLKMSGY